MAIVDPFESEIVDPFIKKDSITEGSMESYKNGSLTPRKQEILKELQNRGVFTEFGDSPPESEQVQQIEQQEKPYVPGPYLSEAEEIAAGRIAKQEAKGEPNFAKMSVPELIRYEAMKEVIGQPGIGESFLIGAGKGFYDVARGVGLAEKATPDEKEAMKYLEMKAPIAAKAGEITGQAAPFAAPGTAIGGIASAPLRYALATGLGAAEGGIVARGEEKPVGMGVVSGAVGAVAGEAIGDALSVASQAAFRKITGRDPRGKLITEEGLPSDEFEAALDSAGLKFDDIKADVDELEQFATPGLSPDQAARKALFESEGIPVTTGELTKDFGQLADEQRLLRSVEGVGAKDFQEFKLKQSQAVEDALRRNFGEFYNKEETGDIFKKSLIGVHDLMRTEKNRLYKEAAEGAEEAGLDTIPMFTDTIKSAIPDEKKLRRINILDPEGAKKVNDWLSAYGITPPTREMVDKGIEPELLTLDNFDDFRMGLNQISQSSDAIKLETGPIINALDKEADEMAGRLADAGLPVKVTASLKEARNTVRKMKTEFSPESLAGKLIKSKKDGVTQVVEASKLYDEIVKKSTPSEYVDRAINTMKRAGKDGEIPMDALRSTVVLDLIDAGFGTKSRQIDGVQVFNPIAFRNRIESIGESKVKKIFKDRPEILKSLNNIKKISKELTIDERAMPKG